MSGARLTLNIDRLVLRGLDPLNQHALVEGLKAELARVLGEPAAPGAFGQSRRTRVLRLGSLPLQPGLAGARTLGGSVATAIAGKMKR